MEIYLIFIEDRVKSFLFATANRDEAEKIRNYINNNIIERRGTCYTSIMANIETIPFGSLENYLNQEKILNDIIFNRTQELESLKKKLKQLQSCKMDISP